MFKRIATFVTVLGIAAGVHAAKTPNITTSGSITLPMWFQAPELQDVSTTNIVLHKTIFDDFTSIFTTTTLTLHQDFRGRIVGTINFRTLEKAEDGSTKTEQLTISSLTGKIKNGKAGNKPKPNTFSASASTSISLVIYNASVKAEMIQPEFQPAASADELATAYYNFAVKVSGLSRNYNFTLEHVPVRGHFRFKYRYPTEAEMPRKLQPEKFEYFKIIAPWGEGLAQGTFAVVGPNAVFTLKASKFLYSTVDFGFDGSTLQPDTYILKTGMGKSASPTPMP